LYEEAVKVRPEDYQVPALLSSVYRSLNDQTRYEASVKSTLVKTERHLEFNPDDPRAYYMGGSALILLGETERGEQWFSRALAIEPENVGTNYNIACLYAQIGKIDKAIDSLRRAVDNGFAHKEWIEHDSDLDSLRNDSRFQELLTRIK
jgi:tetratricopeptide (TPR) repeat protein